MGIIARFGHLLRTGAIYGYIELVVPVRPPPVEDMKPIAPVEMPAPKRQRTPAPVARVCPHCERIISAPPGRIRRVFSQHEQRCDRAGPESRALYVRKGRWPSRKRAA